MSVSMASEPRMLMGRPLIARADETTWRTLAVFCGYRVILSVVLGIAYLLLNQVFQLGHLAPNVMVPTGLAYFVASLMLLIPARFREPNLTVQVTTGVVIDVAAIVILMYASGGV
jgi:two-component system sensor histidine kinase PilS (NtrC family)